LDAEPEGGDGGGAEEAVYGVLNGDGDERVGVEGGVGVGVGHGWIEMGVCWYWRRKRPMACEMTKLLMKWT